MILDAKDLSSDQRALIEGLLGRRVLDNEAISVRAIQPPVLSDQRRQELADQLRTHFAKVDSGRLPGSAQDAEEVLTEAIRSTRPSYRPRR